MEKKIVENEKISFKDLEEAIKPLNTVVGLIKKRINLDDLNITEEAFIDNDGKLDKIDKIMEIMSIANTINIKEEEFGNTTKKVLTFWGEHVITEEEYNGLLEHSKKNIAKLPKLNFFSKSNDELGELTYKAKVNTTILASLIRFCEEKFEDVDGLIDIDVVPSISKIIESAIIVLLKISSVLEDKEEIDNVMEYASFLYNNIRGVSLEDLNYEDVNEDIVYLFSIDNIVFLNSKAKGLREALDKENGELEYGHLAGGSDMAFQNIINNSVKSIIDNKDSCMHAHVVESTIARLIVSPAASKVFEDALKDRGFDNIVNIYDNYDAMYDKLVNSFEDDNLKLYSRIFKNIIGSNRDREIMLINYTYSEISKELVK